jgi:hypothetical protein
VIMDQRLLGIVDCVFDCLELLGKLATGPAFLDHGNDLVEVSVRPPEARDSAGIRSVWFFLIVSILPPG